MDYEIKIGSKEDAKYVRTKVYIEEMGFRMEFEQKDDDDRMNHVVLYIDGKPAGYERVFPIELEHKVEPIPGAWVLGRLAVLPKYRKQGLADALITYAEDFARENGGTAMVLHAQQELVPYFKAKGYEPFGPVKFDEHLLHQWMKKDLA